MSIFFYFCSALYYLVKYGYVQPKNTSSALLTEEGLDNYLRAAILDFQVTCHVRQTIRKKKHQTST